GTANSLAGNGGSVTVLPAADLTVNPAAIKVDPEGFSGNGGSVTLAAGTGLSTGNLFISSNLFVLGVGSGDGGKVSLSSNSGHRFDMIAGTTVNGVNGQIRADASGTFGNGGSVTVTNKGSGGIGLDAGGPPSITVRPAFFGDTDGGNGGSITISAANPSGNVE